MALALGGKLGFVLVKQISKPVAAFVKREAKLHPLFAPPLEWTGYAMHGLNINMTRIVSGKGWLTKGSVATMAPITKEKALDLGAELLGESVVFGIVASTVAVEVMRQNRAKQDAELKARDNERRQWEAMHSAIVERAEIRRELARLRAEVAHLKEQAIPWWKRKSR